MTNSVRTPLLSLSAVVLVGIWSAIDPHDLFTWALEALPAFIALVLLAATYRRFRFTDMLYVLIAAHCVVLLIGGHYTYGEMPLFNWLRDEYHLSRNHYDRVGHFFQGFVPAMVIRELLLRTSPLKSGKWLFFIIIFSCLGISGGYELLEWCLALYSGEGADVVLATQGDEFDTQKDMLMALTGAISALLMLSRAHDRALRKI